MVSEDVMARNESLMIGENSQRLNQLDPNFPYQNLSEFQLVKGPSLEEIVSNLPRDEYEIEKPKDNNYSPLNITQIIWDFLNSRAGKIRHSGSRPDYGPNEESYIQKILYYVKRGMPIELFLMNFSPKFANPLVSGMNIFPDLSNLLALQHLVDIGLPVREVYEPGIRFTIVYEGGIYQELGKFSDEGVQQTYQQVKYFSQLIEEKTGMPKILDIVDGKELVQSLGINNFIAALREEENRLCKLYESEENLDFTHQFDEWRNKFALNVINLDKLIKEHGLDHAPLTVNEWLQVLGDSIPQDPFLRQVKNLADKSTYTMAIDYFSFHNLKYCFGRENLGIMQNYTHALPVTVRADKKRLAIQLIPGISMYPHHGITVWNRKKWKITKLIDLARYPDQFIGVALSGKEDVGRSPFYYLLKDVDCPGFAKPLIPLEEVFPLILTKRGYSVLEDLSSKGAMDSRLFLAEDSDNKKIIVKYSSVEGFQGNGRPVLREEAKRLENIVNSMESSQRIFPKISEFYDDNYITYYVMDFFPDAETVTDYLARFKDRETYVDETKKITNKLLYVLSDEVYSKGSQETPEKYLSKWHLDRLRQGMLLLIKNQYNEEFEISNSKYRNLSEFFKKVFDYERVDINGVEFLNFPFLLDVIQKNEEEMNKKLNPEKVPIITHGDIHFNNVLRNRDGELLLIDPYGRRPINAVETELGRISLSFFADFLRKRNYSVDIHLDDKLKMNLYYNGDNEELICGMSKARDNMLNLYTEHEGIYEWVKNTEDWRSHVLLMEAIHISVVAASKFATDPSGKLSLGCYLVGTALMNNVLARMGFIQHDYGSVSSPMELFIPSGRYNFQRDKFMRNLATDKANSVLDYIVNSLEKVEKHG